MYKPPRCPNCRRDYAGPRVQGGVFQPLILKCGHTFCKSCLAKSLRLLKHELVCPLCKVSTPMPAGEVSFRELPPDFYAMGLAAWVHNKTPDLLAHRVEFQTRPERDTFKGKSLKGGRALCEECTQESATCKCQQCDLEFCEKCWGKLHKNNSKSRSPHQRTQVQTGIYGCTEHSNMAKEFYCKDDDVPICAYCGLTGSHKGHQIVPIDQQNVEVQDLLKPAFDTAKGVLKRLYHAKAVLEKAPPKVKQETHPAAEAVRTTFLTLHAMLQRRETILLQELETLESDRLDLLEQMERSIRNNISRLETVMSDVARSLKGGSEVVPNLTEMIGILTSAAELPCYVIRESGCETPVSFTAGNDILQHIMTHGVVESRDMLKWHLKAFDELPADFKEPNISDAILSSSKLFSVSAATAGKSDLKMPETSEKTSKNNVMVKNNVKQQQQQQPSKKQPFLEPPKRAASQIPPPASSKFSLPNKDLVYVVHIRSPACFYVQRKCDRPRLEKMMKALFKLCEGEDKKRRRPSPLVVGTRCCCKFSVDKQWYRAVVKTLPQSLLNGAQATATTTGGEGEGGGEEGEVDEEKQPLVEVLYIDYGNTERVPISSLCKIRPKYEREPDIALCCSLIDIVSTQKDGRWTRDSSEAFQAMVQGQDAILMSTRGQVGKMLYVDLHQQPNTAVKDDMPVSLRDALVFLELACFISPESVPKIHSIVPPKKFLPPNIPRNGDEMVIQVSHITDPLDFSVQELDVVEYMEEMMSSIQQAYASRAGPEWQLLCPQLGQICVAYYNDDKRWYRAQVHRLTGHQEVEVLYVDMGNRATVSYTYIRKITDEFLKLSKLSLPCQLADIAPRDKDRGWTEQAKELFSQCVSLKATDITVMDVQEGMLSVLAYKEEDDERVCVNALLVQKGLAETTGPGSMSAEILRAPPLAPTPKTAAADATESPPAEDAKKETIPPSNDHASGDIPTNVETKTDTTGTQDAPVKESLVNGEQSPVDPASARSPVLESDAMSTSVAAPPAKQTPKPPKVGSGGSSGVKVGSGATGSASQLSGKYSMYTAVHVSHVESPSVIYVQLSTAGKDGLDSLLEAMTLHYKELPESKDKEWAEAEVCGALLVREGVWCRGRVQCILPDNNAVVLFTDYGNAEVVSITNIRPLEEKFQKEPPFAIQCHLVNILPAGGTSEWTSTACSFLEDRLNDLECYICKKGDLEEGSLPIDLLYELTDKEKVARESLEDLASISELIVHQGLALRKRRKIPNQDQSASGPAAPHHIPAKPSPSPPPPQSPHPSPAIVMTTSPTTTTTTYHAPLTPPSSGVSSLNTTASPTGAEGGPATPDEGACRLPSMDPVAAGNNGFENFEGLGLQEVMPRYSEQPSPILSQLQLIVTFVSNEGIVHGIDLNRFEELEQLMACQQDVCNEQRVRPPDPGSLCLCQCVCARFTQDDKWYRAQVIGVTEDSIRVKYVDFGNTESLPCNRILAMPFLLNVPPFSRECILYGIQPKSPHKTWPPDVVKFLLDELVEKTCTAHIKAVCIQHEPLRVELALPTGESVAQVLLSRGLAETPLDMEDLTGGYLETASTITDGTSTPVLSRAVSEDGDDVARGFRPSEGIDVLQGVAEGGLEDSGPIMAAVGQSFSPVLLPEAGIEFLVTVPHLAEPDLVCLQYTGASEDDHDPTIALAAQQTLLWESSVTELCNMATSLPFILNPQKDMPCCAQYSVDQVWYRAEITEVIRKDIVMCHVKFVDYGNDEWLTLNSIRQLPEKFMDLPMQSRQCRLAGIQAPRDLPPDTPLQAGTAWPSAAIQMLVELVSNKVLLACVEENGVVPLVSLYENEADRDPVWHPLVAEGLAEGVNRAEARLLEAAAVEIAQVLSADDDAEGVGGHGPAPACEQVPAAESPPAASELEE